MKFSSSSKLLTVLLLVCASGCSTFNYEWRREARKEHPTNDIVGAWDGKWISEASGHKDRLRCLMSREPDGRYSARYYASYQRILHFGYTVLLDAQTTSNRTEFRGSADLGKLAGGVYHYEGHATPTNFFSTYKSKHDYGTFEMTRPTL
jgi:hypothetical protein